MNPTALAVQVHLEAKAGNDPHECEDAIAVDRVLGAFAVSDGASEAFQARRWAQTLVTRWVGEPLTDAVRFIELVGGWGRELWDAANAATDLPWYLQEKSAQGSFATFLGIQVDEGGAWHAVAVGDSCLLRLRSGALDYSFPLTEPQQFWTNPTLLPTKPSLVRELEDVVRVAKGQLETGDVLMLASDAFARWCIENPAEVTAPVDALMSGDAECLREFLRAQRDARSLRNDDVAVIGIALS